jgi:AraC-like DNA-binding protein
MNYQMHIPGQLLSRYVDGIFYINGNNKGAGLPKSAMSIVFNLNDPFKLFSDNSFSSYTDYRKYWVAGLQTKPNYVESYGTSEMIIIQFKTFGAAPFLPQPLQEFTDNYIPLDEVFKREADEVWEQMMECRTNKERFRLAEKFLVCRMMKNRLKQSPVIDSMDGLLKRNELVSVKSVCQYYNISRKHLAHLFKAHAGVSPKLMSSLFRFQRTLYSLSRALPARLTDLAYQEEYFDQAHFINDFKAFTGMSPRKYVSLMDEMPSMKVFPHFLPRR